MPIHTAPDKHRFPCPDSGVINARQRRVLERHPRFPHIVLWRIAASSAKMRLFAIPSAPDNQFLSSPNSDVAPARIRGILEREGTPFSISRFVNTAIFQRCVFLIKASPNNHVRASPDGPVVCACSGRAIGGQRNPDGSCGDVTASGVQCAVCIYAAPDDEFFACPDSGMEPSRAGRAG